MTQYIIRLDDLSRFSNKSKWEDIVNHCRTNGVKCLIGVIPTCTDKKLNRGKVMEDGEFWAFVKTCSDMDIAMHGHSHELFGGKTYAQQFKMMAESMKIFASKRIIPDCFIAPKHSYDYETFRVMHNLGINYISDGVGLFPWRRMDYDIIHVPQILWKPRRMPFGTVTCCQHPDTMSDQEMSYLKEFISKNKSDIISIFDVELSPLEYFNVVFEILYTLLYVKKFGFSSKKAKSKKR